MQILWPHLTNRVLLETLFWNELQQKECRSVSEFYKKTSKLLKLKNSKEALHKAQEATMSKKKGQGDKVEQKNRNDKHKAEEKRSTIRVRRSHKAGQLLSMPYSITSMQ